MTDEYLNAVPIGQEIASPFSASVSGTSSVISTAKKRQFIYIYNNSPAAQVINVVFSNSDNATTTTGFQLSVGAAIIDSTSEGYQAWSGRISAISSAAGGTLTIMER